MLMLFGSQNNRYEQPTHLDLVHCFGKVLNTHVSELLALGVTETQIRDEVDYQIKKSVSTLIDEEARYESGH